MTGRARMLRIRGWLRPDHRGLPGEDAKEPSKWQKSTTRARECVSARAANNMNVQRASRTKWPGKADRLKRASANAFDANGLVGAIAGLVFLISSRLLTAFHLRHDLSTRNLALKQVFFSRVLGLLTGFNVLSSCGLRASDAPTEFRRQSLGGKTSPETAKRHIGFFAQHSTKYKEDLVRVATTKWLAKPLSDRQTKKDCSLAMDKLARRHLFVRDLSLESSGPFFLNELSGAP